MTETQEVGLLRRASGSVVVPAHNEAAVVGESLRRIAQVLTTSMADRVWELVVVDDGSVDGTADQAARAVPAVESLGVSVKLLQHRVNRGLGAALQTAIAATRGDVVVVVDCDLSYHPDHIPRLVAALEAERAQIAVASPYMAGGRTTGVPAHLERRSRMANKFLAHLAKSPMKTFTGMVRAYDGAFVRALALRSTDDVINVEAVYKAGVLRGRVVEIPATLDWSGLSQRADRSPLRNQRTRLKTYRTLLTGLLFRPYLAFIAAGAALFGVGVVLGLVAALLPGEQVGLTMVGVSFVVTGILSGLMSLLSMQVKKCFEELYFLNSEARHHMVDTRDVPGPDVEIVVVPDAPAPNGGAELRIPTLVAPPPVPLSAVAAVDTFSPSDHQLAGNDR